MANYNWGFDYPFTAGADLSAAQYRFTRLGTTPKQVLQANGASNPGVVGILQSNPSATGQEAPVRLHGTSELYVDAGDPIGYGSYLKSGSTGLGVLQSDTSSSAVAHAMALEAVASGSGILIEVFLLPAGVKLGAS
jgi:hypothetical protein